MLQFLATVARGPAQKVEVRVSLHGISLHEGSTQLPCSWLCNDNVTLCCLRAILHRSGTIGANLLDDCGNTGLDPRRVGAVRHQPQHEHAHAGAPVEEVRCGAAGGP